MRWGRPSSRWGTNATYDTTEVVGRVPRTLRRDDTKKRDDDEWNVALARLRHRGWLDVTNVAIANLQRRQHAASILVDRSVLAALL
jgi:hypothetical protein